MQIVLRIAAVAAVLVASRSLGAAPAPVPRPGPGDVTPPTAAIVSPASGAIVTGTITIVIAANDDTGMESVALTIDGAAAGAADTMAPYQFDWNATAAGPGMHALLATARDTAGNMVTAMATVTVPAPTPPPDAGAGGDDEPPARTDDLPGCSLDAGGGGSGAATLALGLVLALRPRRRRSRAG
jgi:hypothetical protein